MTDQRCVDVNASANIHVSPSANPTLRVAADADCWTLTSPSKLVNCS